MLGSRERTKDNHRERVRDAEGVAAERPGRVVTFSAVVTSSRWPGMCLVSRSSSADTRRAAGMRCRT